VSASGVCCTSTTARWRDDRGEKAAARISAYYRRRQAGSGCCAHQFVRRRRTRPASGSSGAYGRECLDHVFVLGERQLSRVLREYAAYRNRDRPHQGLAQSTPESPSERRHHHEGPIRVVPVLGGPHQVYQCVAEISSQDNGNGSDVARSDRVRPSASPIRTPGTSAHCRPSCPLPSNDHRRARLLQHRTTHENLPG